MFYKSKINGKTVVKSDLISTEHFFTTREICIKSKEPQMQTIVLQNKREITEYLQVRDLVSPNQTHSPNIETVCRGKTEYPETDALIITANDVGIFLNFADCTPIILYDESMNIGAIIHAGWRGTAANIVTKTVLKMTKSLSSKPEYIKAAIGPAIGFCCYNVGEDVYNSLKATVSDFSELSEIRNGDIFVDLKHINARQLTECGVTQIDIAPYCTCCNNDLFYSYRKENATTNRHSAVLKIR